MVYCFISFWMKEFFFKRSFNLSMFITKTVALPYLDIVPCRKRLEKVSNQFFIEFGILEAHVKGQSFLYFAPSPEIFYLKHPSST